MAGDLQPPVDAQQLVNDAEARLGVLIRQLQGPVVGSVTVSGTVATASGSGFTVVRNGPGDYTITFVDAFMSTPAVLVTPFFNGGPTTVRVYAKSAGSVSVATFTSTTGALIDSDFDFQAQVVD